MTVLSTKKLETNQRELLLNAGINFVDYDAISINQLSFEIPSGLDHIIVTSQNSVRQLIRCGLDFQNFVFYCVGSKTSALLKKYSCKIAATAENSAQLGKLIVEDYNTLAFTYFCGKQRRDELPTILKKHNISCNEIPVYETHHNEKSFDRAFDGILFYSPSGVSAFAKANSTSTTAFCIGNTTAKEANTYFNNVIISNASTIESTIAKVITTLKKSSI